MSLGGDFQTALSPEFWIPQEVPNFDTPALSPGSRVSGPQLPRSQSGAWDQGTEYVKWLYINYQLIQVSTW